VKGFLFPRRGKKGKDSSRQPLHNPSEGGIRQGPVPAWWGKGGKKGPALRGDAYFDQVGKGKGKGPTKTVVAGARTWRKSGNTAVLKKEERGRTGPRVSENAPAQETQPDWKGRRPACALGCRRTEKEGGKGPVRSKEREKRGGETHPRSSPKEKKASPREGGGGSGEGRYSSLSQREREDLLFYLSLPLK